MIDLSELQRDALAELFNIGVGRAAASLSQMVREEVLLSAPQVGLYRPREAAEALLGSGLGKLSAVSQQFSGPFDAQALLVFPDANALEIVRLMVGEHLSIEELSEFEQEAMCEVGNIILNACISALADQFHIEFASTLPEHRFGDPVSLVADGQPEDADHVVLILQVDLRIAQRHIQGHIVFLLSVSSLCRLIECVDNYLSEMGLQ